MFDNKNLNVNYDTMNNFPVVNGELGSEFDVEEVFGYFIYLESGEVLRVEGMFVLNSLLESLESPVVKITRKFFWDLDGEVREWTISEPDDSGNLVKTADCDTSRIFQFDLDYLLSLNAEYIPRSRGKVLSPAAKQCKVDIGNQVLHSELDGWLQSVVESTGTWGPCLSVELVSEYDHSFNRRDLSNMIKIVEDGLCDNVLENNDARNYFISNRKLRTSSETSGERLYVKVTLVKYWL